MSPEKHFDITANKKMKHLLALLSPVNVYSNRSVSFLHLPLCIYSSV